MRSGLESGNIGVLVSGDPLFYGLGRRLLAEFPPEQVQIFPALSSLQQACALFRLPWDDAVTTSLHGRSHPHIPGLLLANGKNLVFTDGANSPDTIAAQLLDYLQLIGDTELPETIRMLVAEDIGLETEKLFSGSLMEAKNRQFSSLNVLCLLVPQQADSGRCSFGLTEERISHSRGLITKNEVRAATLHWLQLPEDGVLWDVGAGSGSLSIEAARLSPRLTIYAVEHKEEEIANIKRNIVKFRCHNIIPVFGRAPDALATLPHPDRVFVGGSGGELWQIIAKTADSLAVHGRLVINGVIAKTVEAAPKLMQRHGFRVEKSTISVTRTGPDGAIQVFNPITIMAGTL
jgi:precorrin-6Y C5,15-methyltransferase (decarboxylating)